MGYFAPRCQQPDWMTSPPQAIIALRATRIKLISEELLSSLLSFFFLLRTGSPQLTFCSRRKTSDIQRLISKCLIGTLILNVSSQSCHAQITHAPTLLAYGHFAVNTNLVSWLILNDPSYGNI